MLRQDTETIWIFGLPADQISAMLTAIRDFVHDSFNVSGREGLDQDVVERLAVGQERAELSCFFAQLIIGERSVLILDRLDLIGAEGNIAIIDHDLFVGDVRQRIQGKPGQLIHAIDGNEPRHEDDEPAGLNR